MADVFLSFSSKDERRVAQIHDKLRERRLDVWWMKDIAPGESALKTVSRELTGAGKVVLAWSRASADSPYVEGEIMHALGARKLVPVRIEKVDWPAFLASVQYVDMLPGVDEAEAWRKLDEHLHLAAPASQAAAKPFVATPRSAGPVRTMAIVAAALALALLAFLYVAFEAVQDGSTQMLQLIGYGVIALPVIALVPVLISAKRVWAAWRSRPRLEKTS